MRLGEKTGAQEAGGQQAGSNLEYRRQFKVIYALVFPAKKQTLIVSLAGTASRTTGAC